MPPSIFSSHYHEVPFDISFSGSGFLVIYQLGVILGFLKDAPWILKSAPHILGASAGSLAAAAVACEINPTAVRDEILLFAKQAMAFPLGILNPSVDVFQWIKKVLQKHLRSDAHRLANGRLCVAVTRVSDGKQLILSEFQSKDDVVQALLCSCYLPGWCGFLPPVFKGVYYIDGGVSGFLPVMPESSGHTLTVCPFSADTDVSPDDPPCMMDMVVTGVNVKNNMANFRRMISALYPVSVESLEQAFDNGCKDATDFLWKKNLTTSLMTHSVSQASLSPEPTDALMHLETARVEEEETRREKQATTPTSFTDSGSKQMVNSTAPENTKDPPLHFDLVKNVLLGNVTTYLNMFGLPVRMLSNLLLPLVVSFYALLQSRQRLKLLFREVPEFVFWNWHFMRHFGLFFFYIVICSFKKFIRDRVMYMMLLLHWLKIYPIYEALQEEM